MASKTVIKNSGTRPGWHHVGCDVRTPLFQAIKEEAEEVGVAYAVIQRWALESYLADRLAKKGTATSE